MILASTVLHGQSGGVNRDNFRIRTFKSDANVKIDGILDDTVWRSAEKAIGFRRVEPTDTGLAKARTEVQVSYNSKTLFFAVTCFDTLPGKRPVESLRPDFTFYKNDNFLLFMDTFNDQTTGFSFGITSAGSIWDGIQSNGGAVNLNWDIKWRSAVRNYDDRWTAEFAIPFRSIRYPGATEEWGINFSRLDLKTNEKSSWAPMPRQFATATLAYAGSLKWDQPLPRSGPRISFIPYGSVKLTRDYENDEKSVFTQSFGTDAKVILSTSMNLDITVNPDYSQVEVDRQQTNLDRFELFFPEKRQFYLENSDLFANLGSENVRPFFSRRIGLDNPVYAGVRLSGKINDNWRIGVMDIQTGEKDEKPAANFAVATIQKKIFSHSSITAFFIDKERTGNRSDSAMTGMEFNRVAGMEFNLATTGNRWTGKAYYHRSFYPEAKNSNAAAAGLTYTSKFYTISLNQAMIGDGYMSESGYIRRNGYYQVNPVAQYKFYTKKGILVYHGPGLKGDVLFDPSFIKSDLDAQLLYYFVWNNRSTLTFDAKHTYVRLLEPFDPTNSGGDSLSAGDEFTWREAGISFGSDTRRLFNFTANARYGGYFNGTRLSFTGEFYYRIQPYASIALVTSYNKIEMPDPYNSTDLILFGPRIDLTFTNKIYFTSFIQYNNQIDNINLNFRFQWRYAPVSDLFIVYTENAVPGNYTVKNRGLAVKLSYWFN
jgi:hypothetical protein